ncbi:MAG: hypothetical protein ACXWRU_19140, partial [Pseudobdellovibrionaceae bacterium]
MKNIIILIGLMTGSQYASARPIIRDRCQTQMNSYSHVTICNHEDEYSYSYGFTIYYQYGLLRETSRVLVGGVITADGYSHNIYAGSSDWSNKPLNIREDGVGVISPGAGGYSHPRIEVYFQTTDGKFDSQYGQNY